ncbi:rhamnogalacturonan acetylesterase [Winogradskyella echinorum]|uniref:Rhamnogalacturonan acetylesterase n=1 Tax=Winogradskyella echinorum TaxID=538189 RepID=A0ABR6Y1L9_9FLAO|nr:rhamnogalacturonan acetylesterase [Winogradskyella echinorum]MBC3846539.1 rhamnogalacturonan acetylesterase [Winogradskyella echinorum]MBC5750887.1 rhamnogalacturonan acetylesterase [Winogradskyella echinorum]
MKSMCNNYSRLFIILTWLSFYCSNCFSLPHYTIEDPTDNPKKLWLFNFGKENSETKGIAINDIIKYSRERGYGFDFNTAKNINLKAEGFEAINPVYFSIELPEGNYKVTVKLGSFQKTTNTTIKAESRRLMLKELSLKKGETIDTSFNVSLRNKKIDDLNEVNLKEREKAELNWDEKLTIEFLGEVAVKQIKIAKIDTIATLFLAGDSTVTDQDLEPWASWGQFITNYLNENIIVANYASSGASLSSFKSSKRLDKILSLLKNGDYVLIQFAHNDEKQKGKGIGPWQSYSNLLKEFAISIKQKGGIPIFLTPVQRRFFNSEGILKSTHGEYPSAMRKTAEDIDVKLIDLTEMTTKMYEAWGIEDSKIAFVQYPANTFPGQTEDLKDNTHFNSFGANEIALCIIQYLKDEKFDLANFIKLTTPIYSLNNPNNYTNWTLPMSIRFNNTKPDGN